MAKKVTLPLDLATLRSLRAGEEVLLSGVNASAARLLASGYAFRYPTVAAALEAAVAPG